LAIFALAVIVMPPRGFCTIVVRTQRGAQAAMMSCAIRSANASPKMPVLRNCWK
jgi:hypothetical protein